MGFNTVVLVLNDHMHELEKCPHALTFAICHPPFTDREIELKSWWSQIYSVAKEHGEDPRGLRSGLVVRPTFHADDKHILIAGWNQLVRPKREDIEDKGNKVHITMPEWWSRRG